MGYFPNSDAGDAYEGQWCSRCVHQKLDSGGCAVWAAHLLFAYGATPEQEQVLDTLIPKEGTRNLMCRMFVTVETMKRKRTEHSEKLPGFG